MAQQQDHRLNDDARIADVGPLRDAHGTAKFRHEAIAVVLRVHQNEGLQVLLRQRKTPPFTGAWTLPSGPIEVAESLETSLRRHLAEKTGLRTLSYLEQLSTASSPERDPNDRTIGTAYLGLVPWSAEVQLAPNVAWKNVGESLQYGFDHGHMLALGVERLRAKLSYSNIAYAIASESFTISELRNAYVDVLGHDVAATNLQRILMRRSQIEPTGEMSLPGSDGGRPARLFRFTNQELTITDPFAVLRP